MCENNLKLLQQHDSLAMSVANESGLTDKHLYYLTITKESYFELYHQLRSYHYHR